MKKALVALNKDAMLVLLYGMVQIIQHASIASLIFVQNVIGKNIVL